MFDVCIAFLMALVLCSSSIRASVYVGLVGYLVGVQVRCEFVAWFGLIRNFCIREKSLCFDKCICLIFSVCHFCI